jgi:hypothetical protein
LDSEAVLHVASPKILDHFSIWDIMLQKAKVHNASVGAGAMETILNDTNAVLGELKLLVESCLQPVKLGKAYLDLERRRKRHVYEDFVRIDQMLSLALCIDSTANIVWKKKDPEDIIYHNPLLHPDTLFAHSAADYEDEEDMDHQGEEEDEEEDEAAADGTRIKKEVETKQEEDEEEQDAGALAYPSEDDPDFRPTVGLNEDFGRGRGRLRGARARGRGRGRGRGRSRPRGRPPLQTRVIERPPKREGRFQCGKCHKRYVSATSLYSHMEKKCDALKELKPNYEEKDSKFFCRFDGCDQRDDGFETRLQLDIHWADDHVPEEEKYIPCVLCDKRFATPYAKKAHMRRDHVKPFKCPKDGCIRSFSQKENLDFHLSNHSELEAAGLVAGGGGGGGGDAGLSDEEEDDDRRKKRSKESTGASNERHLCLKCGQTVAASHGKKHEARCTGMHVRHPEYKKVNEEYFCTVDGCNLGYGFNSIYGLRKHFHSSHVREEERYFSCDYCDERFSFLTTKNKHMKMKHIKPHICDICGKGFGKRAP